MSIEIHIADITLLHVDAVVNAANASLLGGGGVDGAIHRAAGPGLKAECRALPELRTGVRCATGDVRVTTGHQLPARHVFHTVGPVWRDGLHDEQALLANCYWNCLQQAEKMALQSIAFPAISCGAFGFPVHLACRIAVAETVAWHKAHRHPMHILLVAANTVTAQAFQQSLTALGSTASVVDHGHPAPRQVRRRPAAQPAPVDEQAPVPSTTAAS